ncbi:MAG: hypothetical protein HKL91_01470 [Candidatus Eremiobacteraeota bacterium]|nr:hypothetical protein [Candidatus Eremiobacteraeota bacterium]
MTALASVPIRRIAAAIGDAAARWCDADFPPRVRATGSIVERTGYSIPAVEFALDALFGELRADALLETILRELGDLEALDAPGARAYPLGRIAILSSRTTIGVAIPAMCFALCAKNDVLIKDREDALVAAFARTLCEELESFTSALEIATWEGSREESRLHDVRLIVIFGNDETVARVTAEHAGQARTIGFGSRTSIGYLDATTQSKNALLDAALAGAARDASLYEGEGCMSLHALFFERSSACESRELAARFARAMESAATEFPVGERSAAKRAGMLQARNLAAFRSAGGRGGAFCDDALTYLLLLDPPENEPPPFLPRTVAMLPIDSPEEIARYVERHALPIECLGSTGTPRPYTEIAERIGAARIAPLGEMQRPPLRAHHGGRPRIAEYVRFLDIDGERE